MDKVSAKNYPQYLELVRKQPTELNELLDTILINVTRFFRDPPAWSFLRENVLPQLLLKARTKGTLRVWSAGCASGEEVYSAAILIMEQLEGSPAQDIDIKIYATDEDEDAINFARRGKYPEESLEFVPAELRKKYFGADRRSLIPKLRRMIIFGRSNLLTNPPISHIDLLICRNVLIYFDQLAQEHILSKLTRALDEGGVLFLGKSESQMRKSPNLKPLNSKWRIFQCGGRNESQEKPGAKDSSVVKKTTEELHLLRAYQQSILEALEPGILIMDSGDQVITENEAARRFWQSSGGMTGKLLQKTELWNMCPDLEARL